MSHLSQSRSCKLKVIALNENSKIHYFSNLHNLVTSENEQKQTNNIQNNL